MWICAQQCQHYGCFGVIKWLGMDKVHATLIADTSLEHFITEVSLYGAGEPNIRYSLDLIGKAPRREQLPVPPPLTRSSQA